MLLLSIPPLSSPWQSLVCFLSLCICPFYIFHIKEIIKCDLLCLISLAQYFWSSSMCSKYQCFILFHGLIVFHSMGILKFANPFIWWTFGLFPSFGNDHLCINFCLNTCFQFFIWELGHMVIPCLTFWGPNKLFFTAPVLLYMPISNGDYYFSRYLLTLFFKLK